METHNNDNTTTSVNNSQSEGSCLNRVVLAGAGAIYATSAIITNEEIQSRAQSQQGTVDTYVPSRDTGGAASNDKSSELCPTDRPTKYITVNFGPAPTITPDPVLWQTDTVDDAMTAASSD